VTARFSEPAFSILMLASKKILIADDDRGANAVMITRLRALGCELAPVATTLDEAVDLAVQELPSVVLISLGLIDGASGGVGAVRGRFAMPVILIAPNAGAGPALGLDAWDYVLRGCDERELQLALAAVLMRSAGDARAADLEAKLHEEQAFGDLGRVAGSVAHKFNNVLMAVTSGVTLVRMDMPENSPAISYLDKLDEAVERGAELCRQLLAGVRRENGTLVPSSLEAEISPVVEVNGSTSPVPKRGQLHGAVLIVDDDESVRALARWVVEKAGYPAVAARDGDEALEKFRADPGAFGLVLLDLTMPRMSGEEVLVGLRSIRPNVRVVIITGYGEDAISEGEWDGIAGFLQKPFSPDALRATLQRCVG
jgi:DNA-binding response OmpR family regulator